MNISENVMVIYTYLTHPFSGVISVAHSICESRGMVPDVWWGNDHDPNKNDVDLAGKQSTMALNQIMILPRN